MAEEVTLLKINLDVDEVNAGLVEVKGNIAAAKSTIKDLQKELTAAFTAKDADKIKQVNQQIVLHEADLRKLTIAERDLRRQLDLNTKANESQAGSYNQLSAQARLAKEELNKLEGTLKKGADGSIVLTEAYAKAAQQVDVANQALIEFDQNVGSGGRNVGNYAAALKPLQDQVQELQKGQAALNQTLQGFTALQNVTRLATGENSQATELLAKAQTGLAIIQNLGNIRLGISSSLLAANTIQQGISRAATAASATTTGLFTGATNLATIATAAWNAVLNLNPIVAIGTAITLATAAIYQFVKGPGAATDSTTDLNAELQKQKQFVDDAGKAWDANMKRNDEAQQTFHDNYFDNLETQIELVKLRGGTLTQVYNLEADLINKRLNALKTAGDADTSQYQSLLNDKLVLTAQYFRDLEQARRDADAKFEATKLSKATELIPEEEPEILKAIAVSAYKINLEEDTQKSIQEIRDGYLEIAQSAEFQAAESISNSILDFATKTAQRQSDVELSELDRRLKAGKISQAQFDQEKRTILNQEAVQQKTFAIFSSAINGIAAIIKAGGLVTPQGIATAVSIALQTAALVATPVPKFADSGLTGKKISSGDGRPINSSNGDNLLATVKTGEVILNERHQRMLGGSHTFKAIGVPGFSSGGHTGIPSFFDGGLSTRFASEPVTSGINVNELAQVMASQNLIVKVADINYVQGKVARVEDRANI
jgi:hypothetical protein